MTFAVGNVHLGWDAEAEATAKALHINLGQDPVRKRTAGLAGPNDLVQFIGTVADWHSIGWGLAAWLAGKVGDDVYTAIKARIVKSLGPKPEHPAPVNDLPQAIATIAAEIQERGGSFCLKVLPADQDNRAEVTRFDGEVALPRVQATDAILVARHLLEASINAQAILDRTVATGTVEDKDGMVLPTLKIDD